MLPKTQRLPSPLLEIIDLMKSFRHEGVEEVVLRHIDLTIYPGEFVALMGPSGSGKTTLLNLIACIDDPSAGKILFQGEEIQHLDEGGKDYWRSSNLGYIYQQYNLLPVLTAVENVELPLLLTKLSLRQRRDHALAALELVGLADRFYYRPGQLSGGQQQRVAVARAMVTDPILILADEPTGSLDAHSSQEVMELLKFLNEKMQKTIVMVTHDPRAAAYSKRQVHLEKGVFIEENHGPHHP